MGIFGRSNKKAKQNSSTTVISRGTIVKGGIETEGSVFIEGTFEGVIVAGQSVVIGQEGKLLGEVVTKEFIVNGYADGIFDVKKLTILKTGSVVGKVQYDDLIIEQSGQFEGESKRKSSSSTTQYNKLKNNVNEQIEH